MSNVLAVAGVTQLLKDLINDALVNGDVSQALGADFTVTALPPDRVVVESGQDQPPQLNVFLHRITPNAFLRNDDLPTRDRQSRLVERPRLALDLHYMVTAVSSEELQAEILLGYAMQLFHERAVLSRELIRNALSASGQPDDAILPDGLGVIRASELADQDELIRITPRTISMDDMSKMWTALQASYRTTVAYDVSVVLIERDLPTRPTTPVLSRGGLTDPDTGRDPGVEVAASLESSVPSLRTIEPVDLQPVMRLGGVVNLSGSGFRDASLDATFVRVGTDTGLSLPATISADPSIATITLPSGPPLPGGDANAGTGLDPGSWRVGTYMVSLTVTDLDGRVTLTNALPIALAPLADATIAATADGTEVTMTCAPEIQPEQSAAIILGSHMSLVEELGVPRDEVDAVFEDLDAGAVLPVRLRVDGIDSPVIDRLAEPPTLVTVVVP